jgi:hypothetical protein
MKHFYGYPCISIAIVVLIAVSVLFAGCTTQSTGQNATTVTGTPGLTTTPAPVVTNNGITSAALLYGVTLSYPDTWTRQDVLTGAVRDYGTYTVNLANFYSPNAISGDSESYNTLSVDLDQSPGSDFEAYFNKATLAVEKTYGTPLDLSVHSYTLDVSGYKTYELDFQTKTDDVKGSYLFTSTENGMYIFAFKGPNKPESVEALQGDIEVIIKSIRISPPAVDVTPHR